MKNNSSTVRYRVEASRPEAHLFTVSCEIDDPLPTGECFAMPAWIPGSYLIRDFARHVVALRAEADDKPVAAAKTGKDTWCVKAPKGARRLRLEYEVYAWDLSVRGAHFDTRHAFFNGTCVFLRVREREHLPCEVTLVPPAGEPYRDWRVATALPAAEGTPPGGFGAYRAADYAELIDHPVEMGRFDQAGFTARSVPHEVAITGRHAADLDRLAKDLKTVCTWQIDFWGRPAPMDRYVFLVTAVGDGYGGLEHRASTALLCSRDDLPAKGDKGSSERYRTFLGLASHEYFHTWLVKRIRPADFDTLDLQRENPTELLWLFEGFTAYYDDLALRRCGLFSPTDYLVSLSKTIANVYGVPGRLRQPLADASYDAWIKHYRPDENSPNATVSYYTKGALFALALDLTIRAESAGAASLDDLVRRLWRDFGKTNTGVREADVRRIAEELAGRSLKRLFATGLHGTDDLPLARQLAAFGVALRFEGGGAPSLGVRLDGGEPRIACAFEGGAAQAAGLSGGDVLVAIDGLKVTSGNLDHLLARHRVGSTVEVFAFRRDELQRFEVRLQAAPPKTCTLTLENEPGDAVRALRQGWLGA